jgi:hypothetical protein
MFRDVVPGQSGGESCGPIFEFGQLRLNFSPCTESRGRDSSDEKSRRDD